MEMKSECTFQPPSTLNTAVLFLVFNRPEVTAQVFAAIRQAQPPRLYIAADGPRSNRPDEAKRCAEVRSIATAVDWPCEVKTLFRDSNLGCKIAVSGGISWFFENEEEGIILEDDCLPDLSFFWFCQELLHKYRDDSRIGMIAGTNLCNSSYTTEQSYLFSRLVQIWGWATWRRAWKLYDRDMAGWPGFVERGGFDNLGLHKALIRYVTPTFERAVSKENDTWDYQWSYSVISNSMYIAVPAVNLIKNTGFGHNATHSHDTTSQFARLQLNQMSFPLVHPESVTSCLQYDLEKIRNNSNGIVRKIVRRTTRNTMQLTSFIHRLHGVVGSLRYLLLRKPYPLEKPVVLQFPVTDICNSACQMCRIWENEKSADITPDQLRQGLRNPLFSNVASVGLNGGEPTLRKDLAELASVLFEELPKLSSVALITNAYNYQEVIERINEVGQVVRGHDAYLNLMVSLDGYGEVHDLVRGREGIFECAQKVIDFALTSPLVNNVQIGCTIIKENVYGLADLFEYCQSRGIYVKYRLGIPHQRLYTQDVIEPYALTLEEKYHVAEFMEGLIAYYETNEHQKFFYRSLINQIIYNLPRKAGCDWQHRGATITSSGELLFCAVKSKVLGRITEDDSQKIYFGNEAHLQEIISSNCDNCIHDYVGLPPKREFAKQMVSKTLKKLRVDNSFIKIKNAIPRKWLHQRRFAARLQSFKKIEMQPQLTVPKSEAGVKRVLICGWYGTETLGDKAILGGVIYAIRKAFGKVELTLVSLYPYVSEMTCRQMQELEGTKIVEPKEGIRLAPGMDLVVFGGGPLMGSIDQIAEMEVIFSSAAKHGVPTLVAGCGVGPLGDKWQNESIKRILALASLRIYRDSKSRELAADLGVDVTADVVAEDPAFTWLNNQLAQLGAKPVTDRKVLLLGLRDFPYAEYAAHISIDKRLAAKEHFEQEVIAALEELVLKLPELVIRPLPMCTNHFGNDDRWFYRRLFRNNESLKNCLDLSLLGPELTPFEYCEAFRSANVALTMRFHSLVFALGLEVPAIAIDYTLGKGKVYSLAERFGVPFQSLVDIDRNFIVRETTRLMQAPVAQAVGFKPGFCDELVSRLPLHTFAAETK